MPSILTDDALITVAKAKFNCGLASSYTADDDFLEDLIMDTSAEIANYCQRILKHATYQEYYTGNNRQNLILNQYPCWTIDWIKDNGSTLPTSDYQLLGDDIDRGTVYRELGWITNNVYTGLINEEAVASTRKYEVKYTAGYYTPTNALYGTGTGKDIPRGLQSVCAELVAEKYLQIKQAGLGVSAIKQGDLSYTFGKYSLRNVTNDVEGLSARHASVLAKFKKLVLG